MGCIIRFPLLFEVGCMDANILWCPAGYLTTFPRRLHCFISASTGQDQVVNVSAMSWWAESDSASGAERPPPSFTVSGQHRRGVPQSPGGCPTMVTVSADVGSTCWSFLPRKGIRRQASSSTSDTLRPANRTLDG